MSLIYLVIFLVGALVGGVTYRQLQGRRVENIFTSPDTDEANELREEAGKAVADRIAKRKDRILQAALEQGRITNDGVEDLFCISDRTASVYLRQLTEEGRLTRQGVGRGTFYTPSS